MHPVKFFMNEIYRDYWGIPDERKAPQRSEQPGMWLRTRPSKVEEARR